jgi:hypothetical protein
MNDFPLYQCNENHMYEIGPFNTFLLLIKIELYCFQYLLPSSFLWIVVCFVFTQLEEYFILIANERKNQNYHTVWTLPKLPHSMNSSKTTTQYEQFQNYHTVWTLPKLPHSMNSFKTTTQYEQFQNYHTVWTVSKLPHSMNSFKTTTQYEQFQNPIE